MHDNFVLFFHSTTASKEAKYVSKCSSSFRPNYATANAYNPGHGGGYANDPGRFGKPRIFGHKPKPKTKS